jgi:hypothetical protein
LNIQTNEIDEKGIEYLSEALKINKVIEKSD